MNGIYKLKTEILKLKTLAFFKKTLKLNVNFITFEVQFFYVIL